MEASRTRASFAADIVAACAVGCLGIVFFTVHGLLADGVDLVPLIAHSASPPGFLVAYLSTLALVFRSFPQLPWAELD